MPGKSRAQLQREAAEARTWTSGEINIRGLYKHGFCQRAKDACIGGASNADLAELFQVDVTTIERWIREKAVFARAVYAGRERADERVARALYRRAIGYSCKVEKILNDGGERTIVSYVKHYPPDVSAAIFWLTNRRPDKWKQRDSRSADSGVDLAELVREAIDRRSKPKAIEPLIVDLNPPGSASSAASKSPAHAQGSNKVTMMRDFRGGIDSYGGIDRVGSKELTPGEVRRHCRPYRHTSGPNQP